MNRQGLLDLNEAVQHPGRNLEFEVATELENEADLDLAGPVTGTLRANSTGNILLLRGQYSATCTLECARCGHPINQKVDFKMSDEFQVEGIPACYGTGDFAVVVEDEDFPLFKKNSIDFDAYVRQGLLVNLPIQPLCEFGWEGPCPKAGPAKQKEEDGGHPVLKRLRELVGPEDQ